MNVTSELLKKYSISTLRACHASLQFACSQQKIKESTGRQSPRFSSRVSISILKRCRLEGMGHWQDISLHVMAKRKVCLRDSWLIPFWYVQGPPEGHFETSWEHWLIFGIHPEAVWLPIGPQWSNQQEILDGGDWKSLIVSNTLFPVWHAEYLFAPQRLATWIILPNYLLRTA